MLGSPLRWKLFHVTYCSLGEDAGFYYSSTEDFSERSKIRGNELHDSLALAGSSLCLTPVSCLNTLKIISQVNHDANTTLKCLLQILLDGDPQANDSKLGSSHTRDLLYLICRFRLY